MLKEGTTEEIQPHQKTNLWAFPGGPVLASTLPVQGAQVQSLVREDPACHKAKKQRMISENLGMETFSVFSMTNEAL